MKPILFAFLVSLYLSLFCAAGEQEEVPKVVTDGLEAYKTYGISAALDSWLKGSPVESDPLARAGMQTALTQTDASYGRMTGHELIKTVTLSPSVRRVYAVILHEKGPLYVWFECYQSNLGWIIPHLDASPKAEKALPASIIEPEQTLRPGRSERAHPR